MFRKNFSRFRKALLPILGVLLLVVIVGLVLPGETKANWVTDGMIEVIGYIGSKILELLGALLGLLIEMTIKIFRFNNFVNMKAPPAVHIGWTIVRDLSNMMFIVILIVIAFGTIMKIQAYHARSLLTKMIIMIILINFSKTITGLFVDFSQVIMLTFVDSFSASAPIVLTIGLNLNQMVSFSKETDGYGGGLSVVSVLVAIFLANGMLVVAIAVILAMLVILIYRILNIWILVILSPIAYVASVLPNTSRYASRWWSEMGKNLSSGPILAFFLWLSLSIISTSAGAPIDLSDPDIGGITAGPISDELDDTELPKGASAIMNTQNMFNYIITIALLLTGIMLTQELGVMGGSTIGKVPGMVKKMGMGALTKPFTKGSQTWAWGARKIKAKTGVDLNPANVVRTMKAGFARKREQEESVGMVKAGEQLEKGGKRGAILGAGAASWVDNYAQGFLYRKGIQKLRHGKRGDIKDMNAEKDRQEKEVKRLQDLSTQKNTTEAYTEIAQGEVNDAKDEVGSINATIDEIRIQADVAEKQTTLPKELEDEANQIDAVIKSGNITPEIKKRLTAEAKNKREAAEKTGDAKLEKEADEIDKKIKDGKLSLEDIQILKVEAKTKRDKAKEVREAMKGYDPKKFEEEIKRLEGERTVHEGKVTTLEGGLSAFNEMQDDPTDDPENFPNPQTKQQKQLKYAKEKLLTMAETKKKAREALLQGGLTEEQKKNRKDQIDAIDKKMKNYEIDIKNREALGQTEGAELLRKQLKALVDLKDMIAKTDDKGNITEYTPATDKELEANKTQLEILDGEEKKYREIASREFMDQGERDEYSTQAEKIKGELDKLNKRIADESAFRPIDFLANLERRRLTSEASRKIDTSNEDELVALMQNSLKRGNVTDASAVAMQAAKVGHLNELVMDHRAQDDWYEDMDGKLSTVKTEGSRLVFKAGQSMSAGIEGLHVFMNEIFEKNLGYSRQSTLALESDLSGAAEGIDHWTFGQAVATDPDGQFKQRTRAEQGARVATERSKRDPERIFRAGNRLSVGTERWKDDDDHSKGREAILNEYAVKELENWEMLSYLAQRKRLNTNAASHIMGPQNKPVLDAMRAKATRDGKTSGFSAFFSDMGILANSDNKAKGTTDDIIKTREILRKMGMVS